MRWQSILEDIRISGMSWFECAHWYAYSKQKRDLCECFDNPWLLENAQMTAFEARMKELVPTSFEVMPKYVAKPKLNSQLVLF